MSNNQRIQGEVAQSKQFMQAKIDKMEYELQEAREQVLRSQDEMNALKFQIQQLSLANEKNGVDLGNRKMELERQFLEMQNARNMEVNDRMAMDGNAMRKFNMEKELWEGEKNDLLRKMKELNRKIEEYQDDVRIVEDQNQNLKGDKMKLLNENEGVRKQYRDELNSKNGSDQDIGSQRHRAREEYVRSFQNREEEITQQMKEKDQKIDELYRDLRALKRYAKQLKFLAEDLHPVGQPLPDLLTQRPPVDLGDEDVDDVHMKSQQSELRRLR